jgi:hypothetical protein
MGDKNVTKRVFLGVALVLAAGLWVFPQTPPEESALRAAADYSQEHDGLSLLVTRGGQGLRQAQDGGIFAITLPLVSKPGTAFKYGVLRVAVPRDPKRPRGPARESMTMVRRPTVGAANCPGAPTAPKMAAMSTGSRGDSIDASAVQKPADTEERRSPARRSR